MSPMVAAASRRSLESLGSPARRHRREDKGSNDLATMATVSTLAMVNVGGESDGRPVLRRPRAQTRRTFIRLARRPSRAVSS